MNRIKTSFVGLSAALLMLGVASVELGEPSAEAAPCPRLQACTTWCPGDPYPAGRPIPWDGGVCHDWYWDSYGVHDISTGQFYSWRTLPWP